MLPSYTNQDHMQSQSASAQQLYHWISINTNPAHVRVVAFCWKRCELNMFWYHTADVLCTAAHWHGKKHFQIQNVLQFKGTLWYECHDQMGNLIKCPAGVSGPFFLDIEWRWSNDFIISCHLYTPAWTSQNFEPPDRKGLCRVTWRGRSHANRLWARLHPAARLAWTFRIHNSMQLWSLSAYLLSFPQRSLKACCSLHLLAIRMVSFASETTAASHRNRHRIRKFNARDGWFVSVRFSMWHSVFSTLMLFVSL